MKARNIRLLLTVLFLTLLATLGMVGLTACVDTPEPPETDPDIQDFCNCLPIHKRMVGTNEVDGR